MIRHVLRFNLLARFLHWTVAVLILAMLLIGLGMVSTVSQRYHELLSIHWSIGVVILVLAAVRLLNRVVNPPPPLPPDLPSWQTALAKLSYLLLYALMFSLPLVGWAMLSAAGYPIMLYGSVHLPPILPHDVRIYALLR
jgi:cytochrome b561